MVVSASASQYTTNTACQPILTSMPCRPVPLQPVQWFNPVASSDWCCSYSDLHSHSTGDDASKMYPSDSQVSDLCITRIRIYNYAYLVFLTTVSFILLSLVVFCMWSTLYSYIIKLNLQNANGAELESSCAPEGAVSLIEDQTSDCAALYQPSYLYPSYMFGTAIYNVDGEYLLVDVFFILSSSLVIE